MAAAAAAAHLGVTTSTATHSGYLERPEGPFKIYKKRFFELRGSTLFYFTSAAEAPQGATGANGALIVSGAELKALEPGAASGRPFAFGLKQAVGSNRMYIMNAESEQARIDWLSTLVGAGAHTADQLAASNVRPPQRGSIIATNQLIAAATALRDRRMFTASSHEGYLLKLGGVHKDTFQRRYFCIIQDTLVYYLEACFDSENRDLPRGTIQLTGGVVAVEPQATARALYDHDFVFTITPLHQPKHSLFTSLFGEISKKYVFVCQNGADLAAWVAAVQARIDRAGSQADDSDSDDEAPSAANSVANTPASNNVHLNLSDLTASLSSVDHFAPGSPVAGGRDGGSPSFTPPSTDLLCHMYFSEQPVDAAGDARDLSWKRRFCGLSIQTRQLILWKHKPAASKLGNKPIKLSLAGATVRVIRGLSCSKSPGVPVVTIGFDAAVGSAAGRAGVAQVHLAANSQARFDSWLSFLQLAAGGRAAERTADNSAAASAAKFSSPQPIRRERLSVSSAPDRRRPSRQGDADASAAVAGESPSSPSPAKSSSALLSEMSDALQDADAMAAFRARSVELHKGTLPAAQYFRAFFRTFGKELGVRFWPHLLAIVPREESRSELAQLYQQHQHLFTDDTATASAAATSSAAAGQPASAASAASPRHASAHSRSTRGVSARGHDSDADSFDASDADDDYFDDGERNGANAKMPSFRFAPPIATPVSPAPSPAATAPTASKASPFATPVASPTAALAAAAAARGASFSAARRASTSSAPVSAEWPPVSSRPGSRSVSGSPTPVASPVPATAAAAAAANPSSFPVTMAGESDSELRDRVSTSVRDWSVRCEHHVLTLLCTLHEILPGVVAPGAFIPFTEEAPTLRQVHSTYLKALRVLHPDKTKDKPHHVQVLCAAVFQAVGTAYDQYEKKERKKQKKEAAAAAAAAEQA